MLDLVLNALHVKEIAEQLRRGFVLEMADLSHESMQGSGEHSTFNIQLPMPQEPFPSMLSV